jgi:hypothetical protein
MPTQYHSHNFIQLLKSIKFVLNGQIKCRLTKEWVSGWVEVKAALWITYSIKRYTLYTFKQDYYIPVFMDSTQSLGLKFESKCEICYSAWELVCAVDK